MRTVRADDEPAGRPVRERSRTDRLTGLGNRRRMDEDLERVHARAQRARRTYGIAVFDVDYLRRYHDHYGHRAGDEALRTVASRIDLSFRSGSGECAYRYGDAEFLVLMPDCNLGDVAAATADRIRQSVLHAGIPHEARPTEPQVVTLSGGVSCWIPGSPLSAREVLEQADQALFDAKTAGRNRIYTAAAAAGGWLQVMGSAGAPPDRGVDLSLYGAQSPAPAGTH